MYIRSAAACLSLIALAAGSRAAEIVTTDLNAGPNQVGPTPAAIFKSTIAYSDPAGVYMSSGAGFAQVASLWLPPLAGLIQTLNGQSVQVIDEGKVGFLAYNNSGNQYLFVATTSSVERALGDTVVINNVTNVVESVLAFSSYRHELAVSARVRVGTNVQTVVFLHVNGVNIPIADSTTTIQGMPGTFVSSDTISLGRARLAMTAWTTGQGRSLVIYSNGVLTKLIGQGDAIPGETATIADFQSISAKRSQLGFGVLDGTLKVRACRYYRGEISAVAATGTPLPDGTTASVVENVAYDGGNMTIGTYVREPTSHDYGFYAEIGERMWTLLSSTTTFNGRKPYRVQLGPHSMSGNAVVYGIQFADGESKYYKAELRFRDAIPTPINLGDGDTTTYFDPDTAAWFTRTEDDEFIMRQYGFPGVRPAAADYDGDGVTDYAVYDPTSGTWYILPSVESFRIEQFGYFDAQPMPNDYDGDGNADLGVYDPRDGMWYIMGSTNGFRLQQFGHPGTTPVPADFDGDSAVDIAQYEHLTGNWYVLPSAGEFNVRQFGYVGVTPVAADFDGSGADYAVFDRTNGRWFTLGQVDGFLVREFGYNGVQPVSADYDGDARSDLGVYDRNSGTWYLLRSTEGFRFGGI